VIKGEFVRPEKGHGMAMATLKCNKLPEKLFEAIDSDDRLEEKIKAFKMQIVDREAGKEVAFIDKILIYYRRVGP